MTSKQPTYKELIDKLVKAHKKYLKRVGLGHIEIDYPTSFTREHDNLPVSVTIEGNKVSAASMVAASGYVPDDFRS